MDRRATTFALLLGAWPALSGCERPKAAEVKKAPAASKVEKLPGEADLTTIHLIEEAERNLRIATATVERKPVARVRTYGGEVVVPPGRAVTVSAPLSGTVLPPSAGKPPMPGATVKKGQEVFRLLPLLSPEAPGHAGDDAGRGPGAGRSGREGTGPGQDPARPGRAAPPRAARRRRGAGRRPGPVRHRRGDAQGRDLPPGCPGQDHQGDRGGDARPAADPGRGRRLDQGASTSCRARS